MAFPKLITTVSQSEKVVRKLLVHDSIVAVSVKQKYFEKPGEIYLITLGTTDNRVYLFDIRQCPDIIHVGQLWRILASHQMTKVMHDCRSASVQLKRQFGVHLQCVFDTQAAFCVLLTQREFPPRLINLVNLYEKFGDGSPTLAASLQESIDIGGIYWALRPMPKEMGVTAASEVLALLPTMYENIERELGTSIEEFTMLCNAYITGKFDTKQMRTQTSKTIPSLSIQDQKILQGTIPRSGGLIL